MAEGFTATTHHRGNLCGIFSAVGPPNGCGFDNPGQRNRCVVNHCGIAYSFLRRPQGRAEAAAGQGIRLEQAGLQRSGRTRHKP